jgi:hypothetical protein
MALAGKLGYLYWSAIGDDMHSSKRQAREFLMAVAALPQDVIDDAARASYQRFLEIRGSLIFASLNAGEGQLNYKLDSARAVTDEFDRVLLAAITDAVTFDELNLAYARVMRSTKASSKAFSIPEGAFRAWATRL